MSRPRFEVIEAEQRSVEWFEARLGRLTGSKAAAILAKGKGATESVQRRDYRLQLCCERMTGKPSDSPYTNADMQRGIDLEPFARAAYEAETAVFVRTTGFLCMVDHMAGCSLDGDIDNFKGIVEFKCPKTSTHLAYLRDPLTLASEYQGQVAHNLWVSDAEWCDLVSFDDRLPEELQLLVCRIKRSEVDVGRYEVEAMKFLTEVVDELEQIRLLREKRRAA